MEPCSKTQVSISILRYEYVAKLAIWVVQVKYRFKRGDIELEIEYVESLSNDQEAVVDSLLEKFAELLSTAQDQDAQRTTIQNERESGLQQKKGRKSGSSSTQTKGISGGKGFISARLDELVADKWIVRKTVKEIVGELRARGTPGATSDNVSVALLRAVRDRKLTRSREDGDYLYSILSV
jgi:hypothetical protein